MGVHFRFERGNTTEPLCKCRCLSLAPRVSQPTIVQLIVASVWTVILAAPTRPSLTTSNLSRKTGAIIVPTRTPFEIVGIEAACVALKPTCRPLLKCLTDRPMTEA